MTHSVLFHGLCCSLCPLALGGSRNPKIIESRLADTQFTLKSIFQQNKIRMVKKTRKMTVTIIIVKARVSRHANCMIQYYIQSLPWVPSKIFCYSNLSIIFGETPESAFSLLLPIYRLLLTWKQNMETPFWTWKHDL